jgi:uncharacterized membrane protein
MVPDAPPVAAAVARLTLALHASVPAALLSVFLNAVVTNKTYGPCKLAGGMLSKRTLTLLRRIYIGLNASFVAAMLAFLFWNCPDDRELGSMERAGIQESCLPAHALCAILLFLLLWIDRGVLSFLHLPGASESGFLTRVARGGACVGFVMAATEQNPVSYWFLLLCLMNRYSGSITWSKRLSTVDRGLRALIVVRTLASMYRNSQSMKLCGLCVACVVHSR